MKIEIENKKVLPDTSILVNGIMSNLIKYGKIKNSIIILSRFVIDELQAQASISKSTGFKGLEEIKCIKELKKKFNVKIEVSGRRPTLEEINLAKKGRIDALIRDDAKKNNAILVTSDYVQALVGEAEGIDVIYIPSKRKKKIGIEKFFDYNVQSVHIKEGLPIIAKKGKPGNVELVVIRKRKTREDEIENIINNVLEKIRYEQNSFLEISRHGALVAQIGNYRISITRPPFSDKIEITAVRPIVKTSIDDYEHADMLKKRIMSNVSGILIAGPPGSGKSTFAASIAEFLAKKGKIVKTFEQPRDLQVSDVITQYAPLEGDWEKTAELLLLVRPDYTIFDEVRKHKDFLIFAEMRLAGVGMIGVVHSNDAVSAIQRFIGKLELGMIPHVIDTVIFMDAGRIEKIYELFLTVRIPTGMKDADLSRPVIEVRDFITKKLEYEIYTYGEENIVVPVKRKVKEHINYYVKEKKNFIILSISRKYSKDSIKLFNNNKEIGTVKVSKGGKIRIRKDSELGNEIEKALKNKSLRICT